SWIGLKSAWERLKTEQPAGPFSKIEAQHQKAIRGIGGQAIRLGGRFLGVTDEMFRSIAGQQAVAVEAYRMARREGLTGNKLNARVAEIMLDPPAEFQIKGEQVAAHRTFMQKAGKRTAKFQNLVNDLPSGRYFTLFMRVNSNIARVTGEHFPGNFLASPEMRKTFKGDYGSEAQAQAVSRMIVGSTLMGLGAFYASQGKMHGTGPVDRNDAANRRGHGWRPNSFQWGEWFIDHTFLGPPSILFSLGADAYEIGVAAFEAGLDVEDRLTEVIKLLAASAGNMIMDQSFLSSSMDVMSVINDPNDRQVEAFIGKLIAGFIPTEVGRVAEYTDEYQRQARSILDHILVQIPGKREDVPMRIDPLTGVPVPKITRLGAETFGAIGTLASPAAISRRNLDPVVLSLEKVGKYPAPVKDQIYGVTLSDEQHIQYQMEAGQLGYKLLLDSGVGTPEFDALPTELKFRTIMSIIDMARSIAAKQIFAENEDLQIKRGEMIEDLGADEELVDMP
ncbi:MAG: hypothetical protein L0Y56_07290, partial [Nitrospira sp.]|nr:hypothetical protein [Nitrospira sp.]